MEEKFFLAVVIMVIVTGVAMLFFAVVEEARNKQAARECRLALSEQGRAAGDIIAICGAVK